MKKYLALVAAVAAAFWVAIPASASTTHIWSGDGYTMTNQFPIGDSVTAGNFFNRAGSYGSGSNTGANPISNGYATTPCLKYTSEAQFVSDIANQVIPNSTWPVGSCVNYDNESWTQTPLVERQSPETYMPAFNQAAVNAGFQPTDSPALDLGNDSNYTGSPCRKDQNGGTNVLWYENCHIAKYAVENGAIGMTVQNQSQITNTGCTNTSPYATLYKDAEADVDGVSTTAFTLSHTSNSYPAGDTTTAAADAAKNCLNALGAANVDGVYVTDTNSDASSSEGYADRFFEDMQSSGW